MPRPSNHPGHRGWLKLDVVEYVVRHKSLETLAKLYYSSPTEISLKSVVLPSKKLHFGGPGRVRSLYNLTRNISSNMLMNQNLLKKHHLPPPQFNSSPRKKWWLVGDQSGFRNYGARCWSFLRRKHLAVKNFLSVAKLIMCTNRSVQPRQKFGW